MGTLDGKVAIITGGTSGIGKRIAEVFVEEGARIVVGTRRADEGQQLEHELGNAARFVQTDVSDARQVKAMIDCAAAAFGRVDCLVNNAGSPSPMVSMLDVRKSGLGSPDDGGSDRNPNSGQGARFAERRTIKLAARSLLHLTMSDRSSADLYT
jgi:NAD(P)-dependent dehydrogenase (short-subunit alcohol dehydrogenase family)